MAPSPEWDSDLFLEDKAAAHWVVEEHCRHLGPDLVRSGRAQARVTKPPAGCPRAEQLGPGLAIQLAGGEAPLSVSQVPGQPGGKQNRTLRTAGCPCPSMSLQHPLVTKVGIQPDGKGELFRVWFQGQGREGHVWSGETVNW